VRYVEEEIGDNISIQRNDKIDFKILENADAILLSPGPGIPENAGALMEVIEKFHSSKPLLGVCLGHQAINTFFGGKIDLDDNPQHGKVSELIHDNNSKLFNNLETSMNVGRYHSWSCKEVPEELLVTARSKDDVVMAIEHKTLPIYGVQFHPESIMTTYGRQIIKNWINAINDTK
jgi:anthranilate synthase/aminodeoxychorismate synthase-like glutamine amidotransferase